MNEFEEWWNTYSYDWRSDYKQEHRPTAEHAYQAGAAAMKERCHKIAEETDIEPGTCNEYGELTRKYDSWVNGVKDACSQIAAAIRGMEI